MLDDPPSQDFRLILPGAVRGRIWGRSGVNWGLDLESDVDLGLVWGRRGVDMNETLGSVLGQTGVDLGV